MKPSQLNSLIIIAERLTLAAQAHETNLKQLMKDATNRGFPIETLAAIDTLVPVYRELDNWRTMIKHIESQR